MKKTKKMLLTALSVALVAIIAVFGTVAYLTDTDSDVNVMTVGNVSIVQNEQQRVEADGEFTSKLEPFKQGKILMPVTYPGGRTADNVTIGEHELVLSDDEANYVDKIISVTNDGKSDAYVRTLVAVPTGGADWEPTPVSANNCWLHWNIPNGYNQHWTLVGTNVPLIEVDGKGYYVWEFIHKEALEPGETTYPSVRGFYMDQRVNNDENGYFLTYADGTTKRIADFGFEDTVDILVVSQAVQADGFADAQTALDTAFYDITAENNPWTGEMATESVGNASSDDELKDALSVDKENIIIFLEDDVTYDVAAWAANGMGGVSTESVTIYGNGNTITFNQTNSDWNNIVTQNDATLKIINAHITNSGYNDGPWNRHDLNFDCPVVLENVTSDKALAFKNAATLKNVTIDDANTSDTYSIWIQPNGQTVSLDGCTIDMLDCTDGRGIKIDEQYVDAPEKVTLNVSNTTFKTEEKSAILVKSVAGADITISDVDISNVAADPINAVWVDENSADYADKVNVTGATKVVEGSNEVPVIVNSNDALNSAIEDGKTAVVLGSGNYIIPDSAQGKILTIVGNGDTVVATQDDGSYEGCDYSLQGSTVTFNNITITTDSSTYTGYARLNATYNDCTINGTYTLYGDSVFNNCTFNVSGDAYNIWTWGAPTATFNNCTFNSDGKALLLYGTVNTKLTVNDCTFNDNGGLTDLKAAIEIGNDYNKSYELIVNNTVVNGYEINDKGIKTGTTLWANKNSMGTDKLNVVVDGVDVY